MIYKIPSNPNHSMILYIIPQLHHTATASQTVMHLTHDDSPSCLTL